VALRIEDLVIDCSAPLELAAFWAAALGFEVTESSEEEGDVWAAVARPASKGLSLLFQQVPEGKAAKNRLHLDLRPAGTRDQEVERLRWLGASVMEGFAGPDATWTVMQDPEGNEFCVLRGPEDPVPPGGSTVLA
jgi:hypothetical protein